MAAAHLREFWSWIAVYCEEAVVDNVPARKIALGACWPGDPERFVKALRDSHWIDSDGSVHDWFDHQGPLAISRAAERARKRSQRGGAPQSSTSRDIVPETLDSVPKSPEPLPCPCPFPLPAVPPPTSGENVPLSTDKAAERLTEIWEEVAGPAAKSIGRDTAKAQFAGLLLRGAAFGQIEGEIHSNPGWRPLNLEKKLFPRNGASSPSPVGVGERRIPTASETKKKLDDERRAVEADIARRARMTPEERAADDAPLRAIVERLKQ